MVDMTAQDVKMLRQTSIDICRGICILFMILGHQFQKQGLSHLMQIIYSFHMPLMFIISGMFLKKEEILTRFINSKVKRLLFPYIVCVSIMIVTETVKTVIQGKSGMHCFIKDIYISLFGNGSGQGSWIFIGENRVGTYDEIGMLWFLLALFWALIIVKVCLKCSRNFILIIGISLAGYFSTRVIWLPFSIQNGMACSAWVYIGYMIRQQGILEKMKDFYRNKVYFILGAIMWIISMIFGCTHLYCNYYRLGVIEIIGAIFAAGILYALSKEVSKIYMISNFLSWIGENTMAIYAVHFWENRLLPVSGIFQHYHLSIERITDPFIWWFIVVILCISGTIVMGRISLFKRVFSIR